MLILHHVLTFDELVDEGFKMKLLFEDASVEPLWVMAWEGCLHRRDPLRKSILVLVFARITLIRILRLSIIVG